MRLLIGVLSVTLSMLGCDGREKTVVTTMSSKGPAGSNAVRVTARKALAKFQCLESVAGSCEFAVFLADCDAGSGKGACKPIPVTDFALKAGASREIADLPEGFKFCAGYGKKPIAPGCLK
ncbi:hypothetical protein FCE95_05475 [Luteimonas gilva]|uniref:Lipoprotein n=1 Tax=Luteimonas gilva TaxID=2572684 RepID=A0A4U5JUY7_9GAMM|nr:hypothetical protein [Luteimonas gilva]TKR33730.1 hypothetical protein FCE95_05475 [Luteimonas gilva]